MLGLHWVLSGWIMTVTETSIFMWRIGAKIICCIATMRWLDLARSPAVSRAHRCPTEHPRKESRGLTSITMVGWMCLLRTTMGKIIFCIAILAEAFFPNRSELLRDFRQPI